MIIEHLTSNTRQAISSGVGVEFVSDSFVECLYLTKAQFEGVLENYPIELQV